MTPAEISAALDAIQAKDIAHRYARRKGVVVGAAQKGRTIAFRVVGNQVQAEEWHRAWATGPVPTLMLAGTLAERARKLIQE